MTRHFNYLAIGAGSGGIASANRAAIRGATAAVIEAKAVGGTCVNVGCIPKKLYSYAAHYGHAFAEAAGFRGISAYGFHSGGIFLMNALRRHAAQASNS